MTKQYDVVIVGGGMIGLTLGRLLAVQGYKIAILEAFPSQTFSANSSHALRVSAINPFSQNVLQQTGAWERISEMRASPYLHMQVWDATGNGEICFSADEMGIPCLGHIVENHVVQHALLSLINEDSRIDFLCPERLVNFTYDTNAVTVELENHQAIQCNLLIGADGANSRVRKLSHIYFNKKSYFQKGIVAVVKTEKLHECTAWQRFLPTGPLAFLPLNNNECSIVWTLPADQADRQRAKNDDEFKKALGEAFDYRLGEIKQISQRAAFPLQQAQAEHYVKENMALIGDAAHTIHPLAGLGANLGFKDAWQLSETLKSASHSIGRYKVLRRYERARRGDNTLTMHTMTGFNNLFSNQNNVLSALRNVGLNVANEHGMFKRFLSKQAM